MNVEKFARYKLGIRSLEDLINQLVPTIKNGTDLIKNAKNHVVYVFKSALSEKRPMISAWGLDASLPSMRSEVLSLKNTTLRKDEHSKISNDLRRF